MLDAAPMSHIILQCLLIVQIQKYHTSCSAVPYILNPYPAIQTLYFVTRSAHSFWASSELEKSIHSSLLAFSSVHTQHGYTNCYLTLLFQFDGVCTFGFAGAPEPIFRSAPRFAAVGGATGAMTAQLVDFQCV